MTMKHLEILEQQNPCTCTVILNRPQRHNAFHPEMIQEITHIFMSFQKRTDLRAIILKGHGKTFCSGGDLEWMKSMVGSSWEDNLQDAYQLFDMIQAISDCPVPVIGRIHGRVLGGGLGLVAACDIVIADEKTEFGFTEGRIGLVPAVISPFILRKISMTWAREAMLTARIFDAKTAQAIGLIHKFGSEVRCLHDLKETLALMANCGPEAVRETKKLLHYLSTSPSWPEQREYASKMLALKRVSKEGQEGFASFLNRREPYWRASSSSSPS